MPRLPLLLAPLLVPVLLGPVVLGPAQGQTQVPPPPGVGERAALGLVTAFHGPPGGFGRLAVYEEHGGALLSSVPWAQDLRLLPLDAVGRTELQALQPDRPRYRADVPGAARLELPRGWGTLYRYERRVAVGSLFGWLWIGPDGRPRPRLERAGTGAGQLTDPFVPRVAVAADGASLLVATTVAAGGDLTELRLDSGQVDLRTAFVPPVAWSEAGLWLARTWGFAVGHDGVYRFARQGGAQVEAVAFPVGEEPAWFSGQAVLSPARRFAATTAGADPLAQHVWVFGADGPAARASTNPAELSGAGFLPDAPHGPYLAVSDDGARCAWRSEGLTRELWLTDVGQVPVQPSSDAFFLDTLDELGQMTFFALQATLQAAVGERDPLTGLIESIDVFAVDLDQSGQPTFVNRTLSSGDATPPFLTKGTITPEVAHLMPGGGALLVHDEKGDRLLALAPGQVGASVLLPDVKELYFAEPTGGDVVLALRRASGNKPGRLFATTTALTGVTALPGGGDNVEFFTPAADGAGSVGFVQLTGGVSEAVLRAQPGAGTVAAWPGPSTSYGTPLGFSLRGALLFAEGPDAGPVALRVWPELGPAATLGGPPGPGFVLP